MKAKVFGVVSHRLHGETSLTKALEDKLNAFLAEHPGIQIHSTQLSSVVLPPIPRRESPFGIGAALYRYLLHAVLL